MEIQTDGDNCIIHRCPHGDMKDLKSIFHDHKVKPSNLILAKEIEIIIEGEKPIYLAQIDKMTALGWRIIGISPAYKSLPRWVYIRKPIN